MNVTLESLTQAFADWETNFRANPDNFMTADEVAAMAVAPLAEQSAIYFMALLRQRQESA
jgi:hypothetical protein